MSSAWARFAHPRARGLAVERPRAAPQNWDVRDKHGTAVGAVDLCHGAELMYPQQAWKEMALSGELEKP